MKQFMLQVLRAMQRPDPWLRVHSKNPTVTLSLGGNGISRGRTTTLHQGDVWTVVTASGDRVLISVEDING